MRARNRKGLDRRVALCEQVKIETPSEWKGAWKDVFGNENPIHLEIGCGKGKFITEMALAYPDINFIALERVENIIVLAMEKAIRLELPNVRFLTIDAHTLTDVFAENEVERIYLNFSDPWPKKRHAKRRLTSPAFLPIYRTILAPNGRIWMKTDNVSLFEYSIQSFQDNGYTLENVTDDLHHSDFSPNIMTEYELNFSSKGFPIHRLEAIP